MAFSLAGSGEHATRCISRLTWLLPPPPGGTATPIHSLNYACSGSGRVTASTGATVRSTSPLPRASHCALALTDFHEVSRAVGPNWQGRKSPSSCRISQRFDSIAKVSECTDHSHGAGSPGLFGNCGATFLVANPFMQNDPDQPTQAMCNCPNGFIVS